MNASILLVALCCGQIDNGFKARIDKIEPIQIEAEKTKGLTKEKDAQPVQSRVIQAANITPVAAKNKTPKELLANLLKIEAKSAISGDEQTLLNLIRSKRGLSRQRRIVNAYWDLSRAVAIYRWRKQSNNFLAQFDKDQAHSELQAARSTAKADLGRARLAVMKAQMSLGEIVGDDDDEPTLPKDQPLVGRYLTKFDELFAKRKAPRHVKNIDRLLPLQHQSIRDYAVAINLSRRALTSQQEAKAPVATLLRLYRQHSKNQQRFIEAVYEYNSNIAKYAMSVAPSSTPPESVVGMLIPIRRSAVRRTPESSKVQHASNEEPIRRTTRNKSGWKKRQF